MSATYFVQECPTCGRRLQIRLDYLGRVVACKHCNGEFRANESAGSPNRLNDSAELLLRVDQLLATADHRRTEHGGREQDLVE